VSHTVGPTSDPRPPTPAAPRRLELRITSEPTQIAPVRKAVEKLAVEAGFGEAAVGDVGLCVNEALANVICHAYHGDAGKPIAIMAEWIDAPKSALGSSAARLTVTIRDWGNGVNPDELPSKAPDPLRPGGLGLICLRQMMDQITFSPQPDGMVLTIVKSKGPHEGAKERTG